FFDHDLLAAERDRLAGRPRARQRLQFADSETALVHGGDELGADGTGYADNRDDGIVTHLALHFSDHVAGNKKAPVQSRAGLRVRYATVTTTRACLPSPRGSWWFSSCVWRRSAWPRLMRESLNGVNGFSAGSRG